MSSSGVIACDNVPGQHQADFFLSSTAAGLGQKTSSDEDRQWLARELEPLPGFCGLLPDRGEDLADTGLIDTGLIDTVTARLEFDISLRWPATDLAAELLRLLLRLARLPGVAWTDAEGELLYELLAVAVIRPEGYLATTSLRERPTQ